MPGATCGRLQHVNIYIIVEQYETHFAFLILQIVRDDDFETGMRPIRPHCRIYPGA